MTKKATADEEGRKLTKGIDRALHDCVQAIGAVADVTAAGCTCPTTSRTKAGERLQALYSSSQNRLNTMTWTGLEIPMD